jgi:hypothetical protein
MRARPRNWAVFGIALVGSIIAILGTALLLNLTGDCAQDVTHCGGPERELSFVVLGVGVVWLIYLVIRFIRSPTTFR